MFRRAWGGSILTNLGILIQGVGVAWAMVETATSEALVAWVQAASWAPMMLLSIPAGAVADVYDRRRIAIIGLVIAMLGSAGLALLTLTDAVTPTALLALCFLTGMGMAFYDPAWQSSVPSLVPVEILPQAIALRAISQNLARAIGPALGGVLVAWHGGESAFISTLACCLPLVIILYFWDYQHPAPRLPRERLDEAVITGLRFIKNSPSTRNVILRGSFCGILGVGLLALLPLVSKHHLNGTAIEYGIMLGSFGAGAVIGAANVSRLRHKFSAEQLVNGSMLLVAAGALTLALSLTLWVVCAGLLLSGIGWLIVFSTLNVSVQTSIPRWIMGRALATYAAATTGGMTLGSLLWGEVIVRISLSNALLGLAACSAASITLGRWLPLRRPVALSPAASEAELEAPMALNITHRSGPITIEKHYRIAPADARMFYRLMQKVERQRKRNGAYGWSLSRDLHDDSCWIERYHLSTWLDYLRINDRSTDRDVKTLDSIGRLQMESHPIETRYRLGRPIGSVRWTEDAVDLGIEPRHPFRG